LVVYRLDEENCAALLSAAAAGSAEALAVLYAETGRTVFAYALGIVCSRQLAEDVTQDVFVKIRLGVSGYASRGQACGWLLRLTRNTAFDILKKRKHELPCELLDGPAQEETPDSEERLMLREALERLPGTERQIVMLYLVAGIPQKEIAAVLKLPVTTVNWHYRMGIKKLARILKGEESH
jgi:RNA polymerase sigma-70 factor (ECF subfamily)